MAYIIWLIKLNQNYYSVGLFVSFIRRSLFEKRMSTSSKNL